LRLRAFFKALVRLRRAGLVLAYHDRSDGGLFVTLCEMAFAGRCGVEVDLFAVGGESRAVAALFAEELGAVLQVEASAEQKVLAILHESGLEDCVRMIGRVTEADAVSVTVSGRPLFSATRTELRRAWSETTFRMQSLRDNPECAEEEHARATDPADPGLHARLTFDPAQDVAAPLILKGARPPVAILREQGVNSQLEMAAVFHRAGFAPFDVHMTDLIAGRVRLDDFRGLVACGGFSYGDVLGAGEGWAKSILFNARLRQEFERFFARGDTFTLGVCNGCQMISYLRDIIPGSAHWPRFVRNASEQYEARVALVRVEASPSIVLRGMEGSLIPVSVAHGEGQAEFLPGALAGLQGDDRVALRYVDSRGNPTQRFPANPNGSAGAVAAVTTTDGRVTIMMPHPERVFRTVQNSWRPPGWGEDGGWMRLFRNARAWLG